MSASKDKLLRKQQIEAGTDKRTAAKAKELAQQRKSNITYIIVGVAVVLFVAFVLFYNSAFMVRHTTAVTIDDQEYTAAQMNYYYSTSYMNFYSSYSSYVSYFFDPDESLADQSYDGERSWRDYFLDSAVESMTQVQMLNDQAEEAGFTLSDEQQAAYDEQIASLETAWEDLGYTNLQQYLNLNYGKGVDLDLVKQEMYRAAVASAFSESQYDSYEYSDTELDDYYAEHAGELDVIDYAYYSIPVPTEETEDEAEEPADEAEEPEAPAVDAQVLADAVNGTDEETFASELAAQAEGEEPTVQTLPGSSISSAYSEWLLDEARQPGAIETDTMNYVVMFLGRDTNDYPAVSFRHILIQADDADGDGAFSEDEIAAAADEAQGLYDEWQDGDATEDSFAEMANEHSDDGGSNTTGGLYENVAKGMMVQPINDWLFEEGRKAGDTTVVSYDGDNYTGTHVLYFVGQDDMTYARAQADAALRSEAYNTWSEEQMADYEAATSHLRMCGKNH